MRLWFAIFVSAWIAVFIGCASTGQGRASVPPGRPEDEPLRKMYIVKCGKCHGFYDPTAYSDPEWDRWMSKMSKKAKLSAEQSETLNRYLNRAFRSTRAE